MNIKTFIAMAVVALTAACSAAEEVPAPAETVAVPASEEDAAPATEAASAEAPKGDEQLK